MTRLFRPAAVFAAICLAMPGARAAPTLDFALTGAITTPQIYDAADLAALPQTTQTVTFLSGATPRTDTFTGPTLWNVLQSAGGITVDPTTRNGVLRNYVIATGSDGYQAVISAGEIAPGFGNRPHQVAIGATSGTLPVPDGFARITTPGDVRGGRYVSNVESLRVGVAPLQPGSGGGRSSSLDVRGAVATPLTFDRAALQALTPHVATVSYLSGSTVVTNTFTGALLWDVLGLASLIIDGSIRNDILRRGVIATGSDGYQAMFSLGELSPSFGNNPVLVAYDDAAGGLAGGDGFARLVVPGDIRGGRYVSNLISLTVFDATAVPEPASAALLVAGLAGLACCRRRRHSSPPARENCR